MSEQRSEQSIFLHAIALTAPADRAAYLDEACRDQPSLRAELDALIAAHDRLGGAAPPRAANRSYVETAASEGSDDVRALDIAGEVIGPYKLLESIGEGGFGVVYLAEQTQPIRRKVALKVLKAGMDTKRSR
jgi:hypothetical protein